MNIAIIPARGGSRRIPRKNIRPFHGKPIIAYSIEAAKASGLFDRIVVSTEDDEIHMLALKLGAIPWWRPPELSEDCIGTQKVMQRTLESPLFRGAEYACCIYATAPMMTADDLRAGYEAMLATGEYALIHGWFYWGLAEWFLGERSLVGAAELSPDLSRWIDINTEEDWACAEAMQVALQTYAAGSAV